MKLHPILTTGFWTLTAVMLLTATPVSAMQWECGERSNLPQEGQNYCAAGDLRQSKINLAKVLNALIDEHQLKFGDANALRAAQSNFEAYRDNQCIAENQRIQDKPFHLMIVAQCKTRLTRQRIDELNAMLQQNS